jgi:hypothetical protein
MCNYTLSTAVMPTRISRRAPKLCGRMQKALDRDDLCRDAEASEISFALSRDRFLESTSP